MSSGSSEGDNYESDGNENEEDRAAVAELLRLAAFETSVARLALLMAETYRTDGSKSFSCRIGAGGRTDDGDDEDEDKDKDDVVAVAAAAAAAAIALSSCDLLRAVFVNFRIKLCALITLRLLSSPSSSSSILPSFLVAVEFCFKAIVASA